MIRVCIGSREATTASLTKPINRAVFELHAQAVIIKSCALPIRTKYQFRMRIHNSATSYVTQCLRCFSIAEGLMTPTNRLINNNDDKDTYKHHRCVKVRPHPLTSNQRDVLYAWKGRALYRFPSNCSMTTTYP